MIGVWRYHGVEYFRGLASPRVFEVDGQLFFDFFTFIFWLFMTFFNIFPQFLTHTLHWAIDCEHSWACWTSEVFYTVITSDTYHFLVNLPHDSSVHCKIEIFLVNILPHESSVHCKIEISSCHFSPFEQCVL